MEAALRAGGHHVMRKLGIIWEEVDHFETGCGHGIELLDLHADGIVVVAFVHGFEWYHGRSDSVRISIRRPSEAYSAAWLS